jgi:hypothetical protein
MSQSRKSAPLSRSTEASANSRQNPFKKAVQSLREFSAKNLPQNDKVLRRFLTAFDFFCLFYLFVSTNIFIFLVLVVAFGLFTRFLVIITSGKVTDSMSIKQKDDYEKAKRQWEKEYRQKLERRKLQDKMQAQEGFEKIRAQRKNIRIMQKKLRKESSGDYFD